MKKKVLSIPVIIIFWLIACSALASNIYVRTPVSASSIQNACQTAYNNVVTGPHNVIIPNGSYSNLGSIDVTSSQDAQYGKEITIKPQTPGGVTFTGTSRFVMSGDYWILEGFIFTAVTSGANSHIVEVSGDSVRITDNEFGNSGAVGARVYAIMLNDTADNAEVDHNYIHDWIGIGVLANNTITDWALSPHIHHNYFYNFPHSAQDDCNPIFLNGAWHSGDGSDMQAVIEYNVFEANAGDEENICVKNSSNTIRYNVFLNLGTDAFGVEGVSLRAGEDNKVFNNWFIQTGTTQMKGITINDAGHKIVNNYFYGLKGSKGIYFLNGNGTNRDKADNILLEGNTFYNCNNLRLIQFGSSDTLPPTNLTIRSNIFSKGLTLARDYTSGNCTVTLKDNRAFTTGTYFAGTGCGGSWPSSSPDFDILTSGEFSNLWTVLNTEYGDLYVVNVATKPISKAEVGPSWMNYSPTVGGIISPPRGLTIN